ncbi:MAG: hypothetical protein HY680_05710 [Chloroflexi bacterium]|nr:hypothetical protein [Chloroflexota bacterium]
MDSDGVVRIKVGPVEFQAEGREAFVETQLQRFLDLLPHDAIPNQLRSADGQANDPVPAIALAADPPPPAPAKEVPTLAEFYKERNPRTDVERVTVVAAYLKDRLGQEEVTENGLLPYFHELAARGQTTAKSIRNGIWNAASKSRGYLERVKGKRGAYRLTMAGATLVHTALPNGNRPEG